MRSLRFRFVYVTLVVAVLGAGTSVVAVSAPVTGDLPFSASLQEDAKVLPAPRPNTPAALLKTFDRPSADTSLNQHKVLSYQDGAPAKIEAETSKISPLDNVEATPVPEPTAFFLAGLAGCALLAAVQRLRGSKARAY